MIIALARFVSTEVASGARLDLRPSEASPPYS
jgi:hypothetical protein